MICDTCSLESKDDEVIVSQTIERIICDKGKGFVAWLKKGKLSVDASVLMQFLISKWPAPQPNPQTNPSRGFEEKTSDVPDSAGQPFSRYVDKSRSGSPQRNPSKSEPGHGYHVPLVQQPLPHGSVTVKQRQSGSVKLRSLLRCGKISLYLKDIQLWDPTFTVPDHINQDLFQQYHDTPVTGVTIVQGTDGTLQASIDPKLIDISRSRYEGIQTAGNECLQLKTRIRNGLVSFDESDVHFRFGNWEIPQHIVESLKEEYYATPCGELYILSDEKGNLRCIVKFLGKFDRIRTFVNKSGFKK